MKTRLFLTVAAISLPCCFSSCADFTKADALRTLKAAGLAALQGAIPATTSEIRAIQAEKANGAKVPQNVTP